MHGASQHRSFQSNRNRSDHNRAMMMRLLAEEKVQLLAKPEPMRGVPGPRLAGRRFLCPLRILISFRHGYSLAARSPQLVSRAAKRWRVALCIRESIGTDGKPRADEPDAGSMNHWPLPVHPRSGSMAARVADQTARRLSAEELPVLRLATISNETFYPSSRP